MRSIETAGRQLNSKLTEIRNPILIRTLKHHGQALPLVLRLERHDVVVARDLQNLAHVARIEPQRDGAVAPEVVEAAAAQGDRDEGDVGRVHGLDGDLIVGAVDVGFLDQIFDGFDDLFEDFALR